MATSRQSARGGHTPRHACCSLSLLLLQPLSLWLWSRTSFFQLYDCLLEASVPAAIVTSLLNMARQGVDNYLRLQHQEEQGVRKLADHVAKMRAKHGLATGIPASLAATPISTMQDVHQVVGDADSTFALQAAYVFEQAIETTQYLQRIAEFLDRAFGVAAARQRGSLLLP